MADLPDSDGQDTRDLKLACEFGFEAGGIREDWNHLETHIRTLQHFLGVEASYLIAVEYQEFNDERHTRSLARADRELKALVDKLTAFGPNRLAIRIVEHLRCRKLAIENGVEMEPLAAFATQFLWFFVVWSAVVYFVAWP